MSEAQRWMVHVRSTLTDSVWSFRTPPVTYAEAIDAGYIHAKHRSILIPEVDAVPLDAPAPVDARPAVAPV